MIINYYIMLFDIISNNIDTNDLKQIEYIQEMICTYKKQFFIWSEGWKAGVLFL